MLEQIWKERDLGVDKVANSRPLDRVSEVAKLLESGYSFFQASDGDSAVTDREKNNYELIVLQGGCILDYGWAFIVSTLFNDDNLTASLAVVRKVVELVHKRKLNITLCTYTEDVANFLWLEMQRYGINLKDYEPSEELKERFNTILKLAKTKQIDFLLTEENSEKEQAMAMLEAGEEDLLLALISAGEDKTLTQERG